MKQTKTYILLVAMCIFAQCMVAQINSWSQERLFWHLSHIDGLSSNNIHCILKDRYGYLWIGTEYGLNKYDGHDFEKYYFSDTFTTNISNLCEDNLGNLWVCAGDYLIYDRKTNRFSKATSKLKEIFGLDCKTINKLFIDKSGDVWIVSGNNIIHVKSYKNFKIYKLPIKGYIVSLVRQNAMIYLSIADKVYSFDLTDKKLKEIPTTFTDIQHPTLKLFSDENNDLWLYSTERGELLCKRSYSDSFESIQLPYSSKRYVIRDLLDDKKGNIWIATDNNGVFIINKNNGYISHEYHRITDNTSIADNKINELYIDSDNIIWLGHYNGGVSYYCNIQDCIKGINIDLDCSIATLLEDRNGTILLGSDGYGLLKTVDKLRIDNTDIPTRTVVSLHEATDGTIWIGTYMDGLYSYNGTVKHFTIKNSGISNNNIWDIQEDGLHRIWFGTLQNGLGMYNPTTGKFSRHLANSRVGCVSKLHYFGNDTLFAATNAGLGIINTRTLKDTVITGNYANSQKFPSEFVRTVFCDSRHWVWLGFAGGLAIWDLRNDSITYINTEDGLCHNLVNDIIEDDNHNMWISTGYGLSNIIVNVKNNPTSKRSIFNIINYTINDGLTCNDLNRFAKLRDGRIAVASQHGYNIITPIIKSQNGKTYIPRITKIILNGEILTNPIQKDRSGRDELIINSPFIPKDNYMRIYFSSFNFKNRNQQYLYKIDDSEEWQTVANNFVTIGPFSMGDHTLKIKACNEQGLWPDEYYEMTIRIKPPFWLSNVALVIYFLILCAGAYFIWYRIKRNIRIKLQNQQREQENKKRNEMYDLKMDFLTNISHDIRTPLSLIMSPLEKLAEDIKGNSSAAKKVDIAYRNAQYLLDLVSQLLDLRRIDVHAEKLDLISGNINNFLHEICDNFKVYAEKNHRNLSYESHIGDLRIMFDKEKVNRIMYNLLSNAVKFTHQNGNITVDVWKEDDWLFFSVTDDGIGIPDNEKERIFKPFFQIKQKDVNHGAGIGLHITAEYLKLCGGDICVKDNNPNGCKFICRIPITLPDNKEIEEITPNVDTDDQCDVAQLNKDSKPTILLAEDNAEFRQFISECLTDNYHVISVEDGLQALNILKKYDIDIVISDVMMPNIDGNKLCELIKTTLEWSHIPVILLTARTSDDHKIEGLKNGADDYVTKPVNLNLLNLRIKKFLDWKAKCHKALDSGENVESQKVTICSMDEQFLTKVHKLMEENLSNSNYSIDNFCADLQVSRANLFRKFNAIIGKSPVDYLRIYRLRKARQMLQKGCSISEIAYRTGFAHPKYFSKYFKEQYGITPSQYIRGID